MNKKVHSDSFLQKGSVSCMLFLVYNFAHEKDGDLRRRSEGGKREKKKWGEAAEEGQWAKLFST